MPDGGWVNFGTGNAMLPVSVQNDPKAMAAYDKRAGYFPREPAPRYVRLWFFHWEWQPGEPVMGKVGNDKTELMAILDAKAAQGIGGGCLVDSQTGEVAYWPTAQMSLERLKLCARKYFDQSARSPLKVGDRVVKEDGKIKKRIVPTGHWSPFYKAGR